MLKFKSFKMWRLMSLYLIAILSQRVKQSFPYRNVLWNVLIVDHQVKKIDYLYSLRRRSNSIPWCTSFHVILITAYVTYHTGEMNIAVLDVDGFETCFGPAASAFKIIELAYIHCALKENFSVTLTKKGFTCVSLICRQQLVRSVATTDTKYETQQLIRFTGRTETMADLKSGSNKTTVTLWG